MKKIAISLLIFFASVSYAKTIMLNENLLASQSSQLQWQINNIDEVVTLMNNTRYIMAAMIAVDPANPVMGVPDTATLICSNNFVTLIKPSSTAICEIFPYTSITIKIDPENFKIGYSSGVYTIDRA